MVPVWDRRRADLSAVVVKTIDKLFQREPNYKHAVNRFQGTKASLIVPNLEPANQPHDRDAEAHARSNEPQNI
jgi:hypothetical protein